MAVGVVEADVPCLGCAYNLRTLNVAGRCPECGVEVGPSVEAFYKGDALAVADKRWLDRLGAGVILLLVSAVLQVIAIGTSPGPSSRVWACFAVGGGQSDAWLVPLTSTWWSSDASRWFAAAVVTLHGVGAWLLSAKEPAAVRPYGRPSRIAVRVLAAGFVVLAAVAAKWPELGVARIGACASVPYVVLVQRQVARLFRRARSTRLAHASVAAGYGVAAGTVSFALVLLSPGSPKVLVRILAWGGLVLTAGFGAVAIFTLGACAHMVWSLTKSRHATRTGATEPA